MVRIVGRRATALFRALVGTDRYGGLLAVLLLTLVLFGLARDTPFGGVLRAGAHALAVALAVRAGGVPWRRLGLWVGIGVVAVFIALLGDIFAASHSVRLASDVISLILCLLLVVLIARRLLQHPRVSFGTIVGALCVYLVLGNFFSSAFDAIADIVPGFFESAHDSPIDFLYFSFGQLTTVGAPPLVPRTDLARMLSIVEALVGQIYLVTVVALLVGNLGRQRSQDRETGSGANPSRH